MNRFHRDPVNLCLGIGETFEDRDCPLFHLVAKSGATKEVANRRPISCRLIRLDTDIDLMPRQSVSVDRRRNNLVAAEIDLGEIGTKIVEAETGVDQRPEDHVTTRARERIEKRYQ